MAKLNNTKGLRFIGKNKAVVDIKRHGDIIEDALDRITIKEALTKNEFVSWEEVEKKISKKLKTHHGVQNTINKTSRTKPSKNK